MLRMLMLGWWMMRRSSRALDLGAPRKGSLVIFPSRRAKRNSRASPCLSSHLVAKNTFAVETNSSSQGQGNQAAPEYKHSIIKNTFFHRFVCRYISRFDNFDRVEHQYTHASKQSSHCTYARPPERSKNGEILRMKPPTVKVL